MPLALEQPWAAMEQEVLWPDAADGARDLYKTRPLEHARAEGAKRVTSIRNHSYRILNIELARNREPEIRPDGKEHC